MSLFILGILVLLSSKSITGAAIGFSGTISTLGSVLGILLIIISAIIFSATETLEDKLEERLNIRSFRRKAERIGNEKIRDYNELKKAYDNETLRKAVLVEKIPLSEAINIYEEANKKAESGKWIELARSRDATYATGKPFRLDFKTGGSLQEASTYRFYGPKKILNDYRRSIINERVKKQNSLKIADRKSKIQIAKEVLREIKSMPEDMAERYFRKGVIPGKIHEIFGGYNYHGEDGGNYEKTPEGYKRKSFAGRIGNKDTFLRYSNPGESSGASIHHRHWELGEMYK